MISKIIPLSVFCFFTFMSFAVGPHKFRTNENIFLNSFQPFEPQMHEEINAHFSQLYLSGQFNGSVILFNDGQLFWNTYGVKDWRNNDSLNINTSFQLASVSKTITSASMMILVERGQIHLDDKLTDYFPDLPYENVTIEMLLNHRSGLPDYLNFLPNNYQKGEPITNENLIQYMSEKKPTSLHRPGQIFRYNNTNYAILACIIEKVTQAPFEDFVDHEIFEPIGMYDSFIFRNGFVPRIENSAIGFSGKFARNDKLIDGIVGDKGIYSSAVDLLKFHLALENNFILTDSSQRKMYAGFDDMKGIKDYGLGWRLFKDGSGIVYHRGWWNGFKNNFLRIPQRNACVIVLSNNDQTKPMDMSKMFKLMGININEHEFDFE